MVSGSSTICLLVLLACLASCTDEPCPTCPVHNQPSVFLDTVLVDPTEVWLRLSSTDSSGPSSFEVYRDTTRILSRQIVQPDTTLIDTMLRPVRIYHYRAYRSQGGQRIDSSSSLIVRTIDTTTHDFTWQVDTLGDGGSSTLRDVTILSDTAVLVVGEINVKDSSGSWRTPPYNIAQWDGKKWTLNTSAEQGYLYSPLYAAFAFAPNDVWVGSTIPEHWDGQKWTFYGTARGFPTGFYINKIWGTSSTNLYVVGSSGNIVHYDGANWRQMQSGTDVDLQDVYGSPDGSVVWACGFYHSQRGTYLLRYTTTSSKWETAYDGSAAETVIREDSLSGAYSTVFAPARRRLFVASDAGLYNTTLDGGGAAKRLSFTGTYFPGFPERLRGNGPNDLTIVGDFNFVSHFNGVSWRYFSEFINGNGILWSVDQRNNLLIAVGVSYDPINSKGIVVRGWR